MKHFRLIAILLLTLFLGKLSAQNGQSASEAYKAFKNNNYSAASDWANRAINSRAYNENQKRDMYYIRGFGLYNIGKFNEAIKDFDVVLDLKMNDYGTQMLKAECYYYMDKYDEAIDEFKLTEKYIPTEDPHYANLEAYISTMKGKCFFKQSKYDQSWEELKKAESFDSTLMDLWESYGDFTFKLHRYDSSIYYYSKAIGLYKLNQDNSIYAWLWRGRAYDSLGKYDSALADYKQIIILRQGSREGYWLAAGCFEQKQQTDSSLKYYLMALERTDSTDDDLMKVLQRQVALMYKKKEQYPEAIAYLKKTIAIDKLYKEAWRDLADCYYESKQYKLSLDPYQKAISLYRLSKKDSLDLSGLYLKLGEVYKQTKSVGKAKDNFVTALKYNKSNNSAGLQQANVLFANKKYKEAINFYTIVINKSKDSASDAVAESYYKRGMCYMIGKDSLRAIGDFERSYQMHTHESEALVKLVDINFAKRNYLKVLDILSVLEDAQKRLDTLTAAEMYFKRGYCNLKTDSTIAAKQDFARSVTFSPNDKKYYRYLAHVQDITNDSVGAEDSYTKCIELYKKDNRDSLYKMYMYRGLIREKQKNYSDAIQDFEEMNKIKKEQYVVVKKLAQLYLESEEYNKSIALYTEIITKMLKPTDRKELATAYYNRSRCYQGLKIKDKALADLSKAIALKPDDLEAQLLFQTIREDTSY